LPTKTGSELTGRKEGSAGMSGSEEHGNSTNPYANSGSVLPRANHHPTVKPLALMEYLVKLTATPTGGTVCDPFMGSGTTGIACKNQGRDFIGIEMDEEYFKIAKARIG
jgi:site-specific DNA-methyltransferase (adenine-specific)